MNILYHFNSFNEKSTLYYETDVWNSPSVLLYLKTYSGLKLKRGLKLFLYYGILMEYGLKLYQSLPSGSGNDANFDDFKIRMGGCAQGND